MNDNPHFLKFMVPVAVCGSVILSSCVYQPPTVGTRLDPGTGGLVVGTQTGQQLDTYLEAPMRMKREVEKVARQFKSDYASNPTVISQATARYQTCSQSLRDLRDSVKQDLAQKTGTSEATRTALKDYERTGNDFRFYYDEVAESGRFGSTVVIGISLVKELIELYSNRTQENSSEAAREVDARLTPVAWDNL